MRKQCSRDVLPKSTTQRSFRSISPRQHAQFLQYAASLDLNNPHPTASSGPSTNAQAEYDHFYVTELGLLNKFYPERAVSITSRDPAYITPKIKAMLRHKNKLMRAGRVEAHASALSERIGKEITWRCKKRLGKINGKMDAKDMWAAVRQLTGRQQEAAIVDGITAESLNDHYTAISTDHAYVSPRRKQLTTPMQSEHVLEC